jgi:hypothetical protein
MNARWLAGRTFRVLLVPLMLAGALIGAVPGGAFASTCVSWTGVQPPNPGSDNELIGVAVLSSCRAWAVGHYFNGTTDQTLTEHWNGSVWKLVPSPDPGGSSNFNDLYSVAATSASNAWAVGLHFNSIAPQTLTEHWNGTAWKLVPSPNPGGPTNNQLLQGVAATSASNAWAVGFYFNGTTGVLTLIEHWNGSAWAQVPSPNPGITRPRANVLTGVAATSASNAWAVGYYSNGTADQTLIEHWNGTSWRHAPSPNPGGSANDNHLLGVAATSASNAWAVGYYIKGIAKQTLIEHWNGTSWRQMPSPNPGGTTNDNVLNGVAATSASNAWAVGDYNNGIAKQTLIEHWNGTSWRQVPSPNPGGSANDNGLNGVAATSAANIWAVGAAAGQTVALHCC